MGCITLNTLVGNYITLNYGIKVKTNFGAPYFEFGVVRLRHKLELLTPRITTLHCGT